MGSMDDTYGDYDEGFDNGRAQGREDAAEDFLDDPAEIFRLVPPYKWAEFVRAVNADAAQLGVRV